MATEEGASVVFCSRLDAPYTIGTSMLPSSSRLKLVKSVSPAARRVAHEISKITLPSQLQAEGIGKRPTFGRRLSRWHNLNSIGICSCLYIAQHGSSQLAKANWPRLTLVCQARRGIE